MADTTVDSIGIEIDYAAKGAESGLSKLNGTLQELSNTVGPAVNKMNTMKNGITNVKNSAETLNSINFSTFTNNIKTLKDGIEPLTQLAKGGLSNIVNSISKLPETLNTFKNVDMSSFKEFSENLSKAIKPLTQLGKTNLGSFINQLNRIPELNKSLDTKTIEAFTKKIKELSNAMQPLANNMAKVTAGFSSFPSKMNKVINSTNKYKNATQQSNLQSIASLVNFSAIGVSVAGVAKTLAGFTTKSVKYTEDMNLFTVAMGKSAEKANEFVNTFSEALSIDPSNMMRYMGVFQMLASGFGLTNEKAYVMSKNLTQLTYDLSSFYNIKIDEAAQRLQSALAGELEPVRRLGYALDQATLKQIAYNNGIEESITNMTQAEKAQLRYIALLTQNTQVQGDMARTLYTPANAIRVLKEQFNLLAREIGNIFIPILMKIIPIVTAVVKVLTMLARAIAGLFGFKLPEIDYSSVSDVSGGFDDVAESANNAAGAAQKAKRQLQGFDELNNLTSPTPSSGGAGGAGGIGGANFDLDLPEYDALKGLNKQVDDLVKKVTDWFGITKALKTGNWDIKEIWEKMDPLAKTLLGVLATIAGVKVLAKLISGFNTLKTIFSFFGGTKIISWLGSLVTTTNASSRAGAAMVTNWTPLLKVLGKVSLVVVGIISTFKGLNTIQKAWGDELKDTTKETGFLNGSLIKLTKSQKDAALGGLEIAGGFAAIGSIFGPVGTAIGLVTGSLVALGVTLSNYHDLQIKVREEELGIYGTLELSASDLANINNIITSSVYDMSSAYDDFETTLSQNASAFKEVFDNTDVMIYKYETLGETLSGITPDTLMANIRKTSEEAQKLVGETTDGIVDLLSQQFQHTTTLTKDEQSEILKNLVEGTNIRKNKIKDEENAIYTIYEKAMNERGYLNDEELKAIKEHYQNIANMTKSETEMAGIELNRIVTQNLGDINSLSKESLSKYVEQVNTSYQDATQKIENNYNAQVNAAKKAGQETYMNMIAQGKSQQEAIDEYNKVVNKLQGDADNQRIEQMNKLNSTINNMNEDVMNKVIETYLELSKKTDDQLDDTDREIKEAMKNLLDTAGYTFDDLEKKAKHGGKGASMGYSVEWDKNLDMKVKIPDATGDATERAKKAAKAYNSGFNEAVDLSISKIPDSLKLDTYVDQDGAVLLKPRLFRQYATGGFPSVGEFFMARENGPELVGRVGNKTAVANNDQIISGISQGVYNAFVNAQGSTGGNGTTIYIGNKKVYSSFSNGLRTENNRLGTNTIRV